MPSPIAFAGPMPRDELAALTTAELGPEPTEAAPPLSALPWPGHRFHPAGRTDQPGLFIRTVQSPSADADEAVYIHGIAGSSLDWTSVGALLSPLATGHAVDLPGSGRSDPPPGDDYSVASHVEVLSATIRSIASGPVHLVGNSLGGALSTHLAARHPDLFRSLTLISPAVPDFRITTDRGADVRLAALLAPAVGRWAEPRLAQVTTEDRVDGLIALCFGDPAMISDEDRAAALAELAWRKDLPWSQHAVVEELRALMTSYLATGRRSFWGAARRITVPTLVIWGTRDRLVDARLAQRTAAAFSDSRLLMLAGVGHVAQMEAPVPTVRAIARLWADAAGDRRSEQRADAVIHNMEGSGKGRR